MSKTFVKETAAEVDEAEPPHDASAFPAGVKNYITSRGHRQMQDG